MQKAGTLAIARVPAVFVFSTVKDGLLQYRFVKKDRKVATITMAVIVRLVADMGVK